MCQFVFLDKMWHDCHDLMKKRMVDDTCNCVLKFSASKEKRIMVLHAGRREDWVSGCLYLSAKNIGDSKADNHDEVLAEVFENWFKMRSLGTKMHYIAR